VKRVVVLRTLLILGIFLYMIECRAESQRPSELFEMIKVRYEEIKDYQCRLFEWSTDGRRYEERIINFYFKKPKLIRMDILRGNRPFDSGSVAVYLGSGKVKGHRGGILKNIVLNVPRESALATTIRGVTMDESDMETVIIKMKYYLENGKISITETGDVYQFECVPFDVTKNEGISRDVLWIGKKNLLVVYNERFAGTKSVQRVQWCDYIVNAGLPDELFNIDFNVASLAERGIPIITQTVE